MNCDLDLLAADGPLCVRRFDIGLAEDGPLQDGRASDCAVERFADELCAENVVRWQVVEDLLAELDGSCDSCTGAVLMHGRLGVGWLCDSVSHFVMEQEILDLSDRR